MSLIASSIFYPLLSFSQDFDRATTRAEAIDKALASGRLIMVDIGRANCPNCNTTDVYLEYERPPIKQSLMQGFVYWKSTYNSDSQIYIDGLVEPDLPVVTFIQPTQPNSWWKKRYLGLRNPSSILMSLIDGSIALPLMATNLPAATLTEAMLTGGTFTLQGVARTNALMADAIRGLPIRAVRWRLNAADFANGPISAGGSATVLWSATVAPTQVTNVFEAYALYDNGTPDGIESRHYKLLLRYSSVITNDFLPPSLVISNEDFQAVSTSTVTLSGTASDEGFGDNGIASVKVNGLLANNSTASGSGVANWSLVVTNLSPGTNAIKVVATDNAPRHNSITNVIHIVSDTVQPTLAITAPTAGQRWSNAVFTVNGKATDNRGVTGVWCQTNGVWGSVTAANGWTNWNAAVSLVAGTNTVRAYSQDAAGNVSPTQTVSFVYVLSDRLVVQTNGNGKVNPNYNGRTLEIGQSYSMTATAGVGFGFTNWTAGLDGAVVTNKATLRFVMQSNLVLVANFLDVQKPTLVITAPTAGQRVSNTVAPVLVRGRASDNVAVASVQYQLNGGVWTPADTNSTNSTWTNWTATILPPAGTNLVKACAVDAVGNRSPTNWVSFFYVVPSPLTLVTNGVGRITRNFTGNLLEVGRSYTVTAVPGAGQVFSNWVGAVTSTNAKLNFLMQSNMLLQANFVPNPYVALQGTYNGLFYPGGTPGSTNAAATNTGFVKLSLMGDQGLFSGSLLLGGAALPFTGKFNLALQSLVSVARAGRGPLTMNLHLYPVLEDPVMLETETNVLSGTVADGSLWTSDLRALRVRTGSLNPYSGNYTLLIEGGNDWGACFGDGLGLSPDGDGPATVKISDSGSLTLSGKLADGTTIVQSAAVLEQGFWPLYVPLYGGGGFLTGWVDAGQPSSTVYWLTPPSVPRNYYTHGFGPQMRLGLLAKYVVPPQGQNAVSWNKASVQITGGNLPVAVYSANPPSSEVLLSNNVVTVVRGTISNLNIKITASNALFNGTFVNPVSGKVTPFSGALLPTEDTPIDAGGFWLGPLGESGNIRLGPQ